MGGCHLQWEVGAELSTGSRSHSGQHSVALPGCVLTLSHKHTPWMWLPEFVGCGSWRVSAAAGPVWGALEAAETRERVGAPPAHTCTFREQVRTI